MLQHQRGPNHNLMGQAMADANARTCTVYALASSKDGIVRYVGQTTGAVSKRLRKHVYHAVKNGRSTHRDCWMRKVVSGGFKVIATVLQDEAVWDVTEMWWIDELSRRGAKLVNSTAGGEGTINPTDELRAKIAGTVLDLWGNADYKARQSAAHKGTPWSDARRASCDSVSSETRSDRAKRGRMGLSPCVRSSIASVAAIAGARSRREAGTDKGIHVSSAKLNDEKVGLIRAMRAGGCSRTEVGRLFGVSRAAIRKIDIGETWTHVAQPPPTPRP